MEGLQYPGRLVVRDWFLKWNCFFIAWITRVAKFWMMCCVEAEGVGITLISKASTSVWIGDGWYKGKFLYFWSSSVALGGSDAWYFWKLLWCVFPGYIFLVRAWAMVPWVVLPLMSCWVYHCGLYCCMLGKKERRFWVELGARYQAGRSNEVRVRGQWTEFLWWTYLAWWYLLIMSM